MEVVHFSLFLVAPAMAKAKVLHLLRLELLNIGSSLVRARSWTQSRIMRITFVFIFCLRSFEVSGNIYKVFYLFFTCQPIVRAALAESIIIGVVVRTVVAQLIDLRPLAN